MEPRAPLGPPDRRAHAHLKRRIAMKRRTITRLGAGLGLALIAGLSPSAASADVTPATGTFTVNAGSSTTENKTVTVPALPAKADIEIAIDTTGSMGGAIDQ